MTEIHEETGGYAPWPQADQSTASKSAAPFDRYDEARSPG